MRKDQRQKKQRQFARKLNRGIDNMLKNLQEFSSVREDLVTVSPKKFENGIILD